MTRGDGVRVMISLLSVLRLALAGALLTGAAGAGLADQSGGRGSEPEARQGRPERSNGAPRAAVEVAASVVEKWPGTGSPVHYVEVTVTGPFFQADGTGPLTIRAVSDPERGPWTPIDPSDDPWALVNEYFRGSLNFYRNDSLLLRYDEGAESNSIAGVCLSSGSGRLEVLVAPWTGGTSTPPGLVSVYYDPRTNTTGVKGFPTAVVERHPETLAARCAEDEAVWGKQFVPCTCDRFDYWLEAGTLTRKLGDLVRTVTGQNPSALEIEVFEGVLPARDLPLTAIPDQKLSPLLQKISRFVETTKVPNDGIAPGLFGHGGLSIETFQSPSFTLVAVTLDTIGYYDNDNAQLLLVRRSDQQDWKPVYASSPSPKSSVAAHVHGFVDDETVVLELCVEGCSWWARHATVELNLRTLSGRILP